MKNKMGFKIYIYVLQLISFYSCTQPQENHEAMIDRINVQYVGLTVMTSIRVDCGEFDSYFNQAIKKQEITSREFLDRFLSQLRKLKEIDENYYPVPDTRIKMEVFINNKTELICIGNLVVKYKDQSYINDNNFKKLLLNVLD